MPTAAQIKAAFAHMVEDERSIVNTIYAALGHPLRASDGKRARTAQPQPQPDHDADQDDEEEQQQRPRKRRKGNDNGSSKYDPRRDAYSVLADSGQFFVIAVHAYDTIPNTLEHGAAHRWCPNALVVPPNAKDQANHARYLANFAVWFEHISKFNDAYKFDAPLKFLYLYEQAVWNELVDQMASAAATVREQNTNRLKKAPELLIPPTHPDGSIHPRIRGEEKSHRGVNHPLTRNYLLSPADLKHFPEMKFDASDKDLVLRYANPLPATTTDVLTPQSDEAKEIVAKLVAGTKRFTNAEYFAALYKDPAAVRKTNDGLFLGFLVIRVLRHVWTGPSTAEKGLANKPAIPAQCSSRRHRCFKFTPRMVAYAVCQVRTMLHAGDWGKKDGKYSYQTLFNGVVKLLSSEAEGIEAWAQQTLEALNEAVFSSHALTFEDDEDAGPDAADLLMQEMTANNFNTLIDSLLLLLAQPLDQVHIPFLSFLARLYHDYRLGTQTHTRIAMTVLT
ncbi:hypothetical protein HMN09_01092800 [Mycena chlorophos]|uniref:Uncharacterized protein n=1 Tax=Mycena chlorophos TaxID=658473 RepID=A0A8H6VZQ3_MYCCL|nr:hypothetical protein HMN09_01092800 [Mycena chlorophos]